MHPFVFEVVFAALVLIFAVTQLLIPAFTGTPYFPTFRFRRQDRAREQVQADIAATESEIEIERDKQSLHRLQERLRTEQERRWPASSTTSQVADPAATTAPSAAAAADDPNSPAT